MPLDRILIEDLLVRCTIGVSSEERREKEDILMNIALWGDFSEAEKSDRIEDAMDYRLLKKRIFTLAEKSRYALIETLAERVASICLATPKVSKAQVTVKKTSVLRFAKSVSVEILRRSRDRKLVEAFLSLGSNIRPELNIPKAIELLSDQVTILAVSKFYRTHALGEDGSPLFVNGVIKVQTSAIPMDLKFGILRPIEEQLGRIRSLDKNAPRTMDIDILTYGNIVIKEENLVVPDPEILSRDFLAIPLAELSPEFVLPGTKKRLSEIAKMFIHPSMEPIPEFFSRIELTRRNAA